MLVHSRLAGFTCKGVTLYLVLSAPILLITYLGLAFLRGPQVCLPLDWTLRSIH